MGLVRTRQRTRAWCRRGWTFGLVSSLLGSGLVLATAEPSSAQPNSSVMAWGSNNQGELGNVTIPTNASTPVQVDCGAAPAPNCNSGYLTNGVTAIVSGYLHSLVLLADGTVMAWGDNSAGELGNGVGPNQGKPVEVDCGTAPLADCNSSGYLTNVIAISAGVDDSLARLSDGTVMAWGLNNQGQLGNGVGPNQSEPVEVDCGTAPLADCNSSGFLTNVTDIAAGGYHSLARLSDGTVMAWGLNNQGQLGNGGVINQSKPVEVDCGAAPAADCSGGLLKKVMLLAGGIQHSLAVLSDGRVMTWGDNGAGQLGNGGFISQSKPVEVECGTAPAAYCTSGISPLLRNIIGIAGGNEHSLALLADGSVMAWGSNNQGELGIGVGPNQSKPVEVDCGTAPLADCNSSGFLTNVIAIAAAPGDGWTNLALLYGGSVIAWGDNSNGQLGNGNVGTNQNKPVQVTGLTGVTAIAAGGPHSLALVAPAYLVKVKGSTDGRCATWATACTLTRALTLDVTGAQIWMESGTYTAHNNSLINCQDHLTALNDGVTIIGGFEGLSPASSVRLGTTTLEPNILGRCNGIIDFSLVKGVTVEGLTVDANLTMTYNLPQAPVLNKGGGGPDFLGATGYPVLVEAPVTQKVMVDLAGGSTLLNSVAVDPGYTFAGVRCNGIGTAVSIIDSSITGPDDARTAGIDLQDGCAAQVNGVGVYGNTVTANGYGMVLQGETDQAVGLTGNPNTITGNGSGIIIGAYCASELAICNSVEIDSMDNTISSATINNNAAFGVEIEGPDTPQEFIPSEIESNNSFPEPPDAGDQTGNVITDTNFYGNGVLGADVVRGANMVDFNQYGGPSVVGNGLVWDNPTITANTTPTLASTGTVALKNTGGTAIIVHDGQPLTLVGLGVTLYINIGVGIAYVIGAGAKVTFAYDLIYPASPGNTDPAAITMGITAAENAPVPAGLGIAGTSPLNTGNTVNETATLAGCNGALTDNTTGVPLTMATTVDGGYYDC